MANERMNSIQKTNLNIDYSVAFHVDGGMGKRKATQLKAKQLELRSNRFRFYSLNRGLIRFFGVYIAMLLTEIGHVLSIIFRADKPDIIFARTFFGYLYVIIGKIYDIKIVREVHNEFKDESHIFFKNNSFKKLFSSIINYIETKSLSKSDGVIFNNPDLQAYFISEYELKSVKTTSVYNGSDPDLFYPENKQIVRNRLGIPLRNSDRVLMFTGSVVEWHGVDYLIEVFRKLTELAERKRADHDIFYLYIVGMSDTPYQNQLKKSYRNVPNLVFVDKVSVDEARDYINAADLCMVTTANILISQGSPTKMYDYIACGKPVVSQKDVVGYGSVVDEHGLGCSVDFMNPEEAARDIYAFIQSMDPGQLARHNRKKAENELNWGSTVEKWISFAESL